MGCVFEGIFFLSNFSTEVSMSIFAYCYNFCSFQVPQVHSPLLFLLNNI